MLLEEGWGCAEPAAAAVTRLQRAAGWDDADNVNSLCLYPSHALSSQAQYHSWLAFELAPCFTLGENMQYAKPICHWESIIGIRCIT